MIQIKKHLDRFCQSLQKKGKHQATIIAYRNDALGFLEFIDKHSIPVNKLEPSHLTSFLLELKKKNKSKDNSIRRKSIGVRQYFRFLASIKAIESSPFESVGLIQRNEHVPTHLTEAEFKKVLTSAQQTTQLIKKTRDTAIVALLAFEGLKVSEIINLKWSDFLEERNYSSLRIQTDRKRIIILNEKTRIYLNNYKKAVKQTVGRDFLKASSHMILGFAGRGYSSISAKLSRHGIKYMLYELAERSAIKHLNTEVLRHSAIITLLERGLKPEEVMHHLGLRQIGIISKYL